MKITKEVDEPEVLRDASGEIVAVGDEAIRVYHHEQKVATLKARAAGGPPHFGTAPPVPSGQPPAARIDEDAKPLRKRAKGGEEDA